MSSIAFGAKPANSLENSGNDSVAASSKELESLIPVCSGERKQFALEKGAGPMEASLHVFFTDLQAFGGFGGTQSFDFPSQAPQLCLLARDLTMAPKYVLERIARSPNFSFPGS